MVSSVLVSGGVVDPRRARHASMTCGLRMGLVAEHPQRVQPPSTKDRVPDSFIRVNSWTAPPSFNLFVVLRNPAG